MRCRTVVGGRAKAVAVLPGQQLSLNAGNRPMRADGRFGRSIVRWRGRRIGLIYRLHRDCADAVPPVAKKRSEEHTSELQSIMRISYAVFCLKKKTSTTNRTIPYPFMSTNIIMHSYFPC